MLRKPNKYRILADRSPRLNEFITEMILRAYMAPVNRILKQSHVFSLNLPHIGTIKTHGNKKKNLTKGIKKYQRKYHKKRNKKETWTDLELLS